MPKKKIEYEGSDRELKTDILVKGINKRAVELKMDGE
jgi:hypothetical protein